jgi:hypothetical protein
LWPKKVSPDVPPLLKSSKRTILVLFLLVLPIVAGSQPPRTRISLFEREISFPFDSTRTRYKLPDSLLIASSVSVRLDSVSLDSSLFRVEAIPGNLILFPERQMRGDSLRIRYQVFPFRLRQAYYHRVPVPPTEDSTQTGKGGQRPVPAAKGGAATKDFGSDLRKSGSIIRGVSVGSNQGLTVDSGLRMQISGKLSDNIDVVASLTDQNTPIQPEGNTQTLREIDKVFVQVKSPHLRTTLGDYDLSLTGTQFTGYGRKLSGVMGQADYDNSKVTLSAGVSRGQFATNEFLGLEGNQGPYQLSTPEGQIDIIVLAGTERVWVDGEPMKRGESLDYVIEYGNGQITFARNRLITSDSRITVDFQYSDESFQRSFWAARGSHQMWGGRVSIGTTFIRESDDSKNPISFVLSESALAALEAAGDDEAIVPGDTLVGEGKGAYLLREDGVFEFAGTGRGDHNVAFSFFGQGNGDYRNVGLGRYEYVGEGLGSYLPFLILPKARKHNMTGLNLDLQPAESIQINSEIAFSQFDSNVYSAIDDANNAGNAYAVRWDLRPNELSGFGRIRVSGEVRRKNADFQDIDRTTAAEFNRKWNIENTGITREENVLELNGQYEPVNGVSVSTGIGRLSKSTAFESNRWDVRARLNRNGLPQLDYFVEQIDRSDNNLVTSSDWLRQRGRVNYALKFVEPIVEYEGEIRKDAGVDTNVSGFRFDSYTFGLNTNPFKVLSATARFNVRDDKERIAGVFEPKSIARTQSYGWSLQRWKSFDASASYTHRTRDFSNPEIQDTRTDLADLRLGYGPANRTVRSNIYYQISNTQIARQEEVFIEVEEGEGNYEFNQELGEFEPDPFGRFVRRLFVTKDFIPVVELRLRGDLKLTPGQWIGNRKGFLASILAPVSTETFLRIDERTREPNVSRIYLLDLDYFRNDSTTVFGSLELRNDIYLWQNNREFSLRFRHRSREELNNQFVEGGQDRNVRETSIRTVFQFNAQVTSQLETIHAEEDRLFKTGMREDRKVRSNQVDLDVTYRPVQRLELALKSGASLNRDVVQTPNTEANLISLAPRSNYSLSQKGRLRAEIEWTRVTVSPPDRLIPYELTRGNRAGTTFRWNFSFEYRVSRNVQASLSYFGRSEPQRPDTQHIAKMEMRAFF